MMHLNLKSQRGQGGEAVALIIAILIVIFFVIPILNRGCPAQRSQRRAPRTARRGRTDRRSSNQSQPDKSSRRTNAPHVKQKQKEQPIQTRPQPAPEPEPESLPELQVVRVNLGNTGAQVVGETRASMQGNYELVVIAFNMDVLECHVDGEMAEPVSPDKLPMTPPEGFSRTWVVRVPKEQTTNLNIEAWDADDIKHQFNL